MLVNLSDREVGKWAKVRVTLAPRYWKFLHLRRARLVYIESRLAAEA